MARTIRTKVYKFSELSNDAQQKAIENLFDINVDYDWWQSTCDDAENVYIKITGFDIDRGSYCKGEFTDSATMTANKILEDHGDTCETYKTAKDFLSEYDNLVKKYASEENPNEVSEDNEYEFDSEADELEEDFLKDILEDYRIMLQNEFEYLQSKEAIISTIEANEYEFYVNGKML